MPSDRLWPPLRQNRKERRAIVVISVGDRPWLSHNLPTVERYAGACSADFALVERLPDFDEFPFEAMPDKPGRPNKAVYAAKAFIPWLYLTKYGYDRVLVLDDTCIVSGDAPDVFAMTPPRHCGFTKTNRSHAETSFAAISRFLEERGLPPIKLKHEYYMNTGLVLYDRAFAEALSWERLSAAKDLLYAKYPHQTLNYYLLMSASVRFFRLDRLFNSLPRDRVGSFLTEAREAPDSIQPAHIYHVTGAFQHRRELIESLATRARGEATGRRPDELARSLRVQNGPRPPGGKSREPEPSMTVLEKFTRDIQLHPTQIAAVAGAIKRREKGCNLLVFGVGNDSGMWRALNKGGATLFVEDDTRWLAKVKKRNPEIDCILVDYGATSVAASLADLEGVIAAAQPPEPLLARPWDVVLIDGPRGYRPENPGRALPICWTAAIRKKDTDIFVDDAERELERRFAERLLIPGSGNHILIRRPRRSSLLLWVIGDPA